MDACDKEADLQGIRILRTDISMFHPLSFSRRGSTSHRQTEACLHGDHAPGHETQSMSLKEKKRALLSTACEHFLASTLDIPEAPILAWPILAHRQLHASAAGMQREAGVRSRPGQSVDARLSPPLPRRRMYRRLLSDRMGLTWGGKHCVLSLPTASSIKRP